MIDQKRLEQLVRLMVDNDLSELDIRSKDETVALKRAYAGAHLPMPMPQHASHAGHAPAHSAPPASAESSKSDEGLVAIESPMVGTFYAKPNPESEPFVKVGSSVGPDTVVCLIEAMKVFNEVQANVAGRIERVLVENGDPVEFGQALFLVKPN